MQYSWSLSMWPPFWLQDHLPQLYLYKPVTYQQQTHTLHLTSSILVFSLFSFFPSFLLSLMLSAFKMASILQKLMTPLFSGPPEPPRNKVTVVGVGQVGMACAVSILLRVRAPLVLPLCQLSSCLLVSPYGVIPRILLNWHQITDLLRSDLGLSSHCPC